MLEKITTLSDDVVGMFGGGTGGVDPNANDWFIFSFNYAPVNISFAGGDVTLYFLTAADAPSVDTSTIVAMIEFED